MSVDSETNREPSTNSDFTLLGKVIETSVSTQQTFSVIICTHNRCSLLSDVVASVREQRYPQERYEIIIADNASSDGTRQEVERLQQLPGHPVRYLYEPRLGKPHACNAGAQAAQGDILAFLDDDIIANPDWLAGLAQAYEFGGADVGGAGGGIRIQWEGPRPPWLLPELEGYLGSTGRHGETMRVLDDGMDLPGGNLSVVRSYFDEIGRFSTDLGPHGEKLLLRYHDDVELCQRIWRHGRRLVYAPQAWVYHRIFPAQMTRAYFLNRGYAQGLSDVALAQLQSPRSRLRLLRAAAADAVFLARDVLRYLAKQIGKQRPAAFAQLVYTASQWGRVQQGLKLALVGSKLS